MSICEYDVGDKVVHPLHGAGIIVSREKDSILGEEQDYYILNILVGNGIRVMIPTSKVETVGLRKINEKQDIDNAFNDLCKTMTFVDTDARWNKRQQDNMKKIRSGNFSDVLWVFMSLVLRAQKRDLSTCERKMMATTKNIITSELILANNMTQDEVEEFLQGYVDIVSNIEEDGSSGVSDNQDQEECSTISNLESNK